MSHPGFNQSDSLNVEFKVQAYDIEFLGKFLLDKSSSGICKVQKNYNNAS